MFPYSVRVIRGCQVPRATLRAQGVTSSHRSVSRFVSRRYPAFIAHTGSCDDPKPSTHLRNEPRHAVFAGCCQPLLGVGPSRRYSATLLSACKDPYPGCSRGAHARFFPQDDGLPDVMNRSALGKTHTLAIAVWSLFRGCSHSITLQPADLLAPQIAPTAGLSSRAARAFNFPHISVCYLAEQGIC